MKKVLVLEGIESEPFSVRDVFRHSAKLGLLKDAEQ
jgi:hypothetical protein